MNAIALCHNCDLQKTNGRIIVLGTGSIPLMQTATWVNMQLYSQSKLFVLLLDVMVCLSVCSLWTYICMHTFFTAPCPPSTHLSLPNCHAQINLFARPTWSPKWMNWCSLLFLKPNQRSFSLFNMPPRDGALLCSLLTVKSLENGPEMLSKKECK